MMEHASQTTTQEPIHSLVDPNPTLWKEGTIDMYASRYWNSSGQSETGQNGAQSGWNGSGQNGHGWGGGLKEWLKIKQAKRGRPEEDVHLFRFSDSRGY